jgi:hypothetical protein
MMSAGELLTNADALLLHNTCALVFWQWSEEHPEYLLREDIRLAMEELARLTRNHGARCSGVRSAPP